MCLSGFVGATLASPLFQLLCYYAQANKNKGDASVAPTKLFVLRFFNGEQARFIENQILDAVFFDFGAAVFRVDDDVALFH